MVWFKGKGTVNNISKVQRSHFLYFQVYRLANIIHFISWLSVPVSYISKSYSTPFNITEITKYKRQNGLLKKIYKRRY